MTSSTCDGSDAAGRDDMQNVKLLRVVKPSTAQGRGQTLKRPTYYGLPNFILSGKFMKASIRGNNVAVLSQMQKNDCCYSESKACKLKQHFIGKVLGWK